MAFDSGLLQMYRAPRNLLQVWAIYNMNRAASRVHQRLLRLAGAAPGKYEDPRFGSGAAWGPAGACRVQPLRVWQHERRVHPHRPRRGRTPWRYQKRRRSWIGGLWRGSLLGGSHCPLGVKRTPENCGHEFVTSRPSVNSGLTPGRQLNTLKWSSETILILSSHLSR